MNRTPAKYLFALSVFLVSEGTLVWQAFHVRGWMIPFAVFVAPYVGGGLALLAGGVLLLISGKSSRKTVEKSTGSFSLGGSDWRANANPILTPAATLRSDRNG